MSTSQAAPEQGTPVLGAMSSPEEVASPEGHGKSYAASSPQALPRDASSSVFCVSAEVFAHEAPETAIAVLGALSLPEDVAMLWDSADNFGAGSSLELAIPVIGDTPLPEQVS